MTLQPLHTHVACLKRSGLKRWGVGCLFIAAGLSACGLIGEEPYSRSRLIPAGIYSDSTEREIYEFQADGKGAKTEIWSQFPDTSITVYNWYTFDPSGGILRLALNISRRYEYKKWTESVTTRYLTVKDVTDSSFSLCARPRDRCSGYDWEFFKIKYQPPSIP